MKHIDGLKREEKPTGKDFGREPAVPKREQSAPAEEVFSELFSKKWQDENNFHFASGKGFSLRRKSQKQAPKRPSAHIPRLKISEKAAWRVLASLVLIFALVVGALLFADQAKSAMNEKSASLEANISLASDAMSQGTTDEALKHLQDAYKDIYDLKLMAQRYGQDIGYLRFSPLEKSKLTASENVLDATFTILDSTQKFQQKLTEVLSADNKSDNPLLINLSDGRQKLSDYMKELRRNLQNSSADLERASKYQDPATKEKLAATDEQISKLLANFSLYEDVINTDLPWLFGENSQSRKMLIAFQNNSELRGGSGGSLGSFAVANFINGELKSIDFGKNIFKIDQAYEAGNYIAPPDEIKFLRGNFSWTMKDSGWSVDGAEAYSNIIDFYKKETGESVDGAIMIDTTAVSALLKVTGPIEMKAYGKTIDSENFRTELEKETHEDYWTRTGNEATNEPKQIINDMIPIFIPKVMSGLADKDQSLEIISALSKSIKAKDILITSENKDFQNHLALLNLSGQVAKSVGDYVYVTNSNIDGGKSSLDLDESLSLLATIANNGEIINELSLERAYPSNSPQTAATNTNFTRLLVADGSSLKSFDPKSGNYEQYHNNGYKNGQKYWEENLLGKKMINFWCTTRPGDTSRAIINYKSGYKISPGDDFTYVITVQKQPGAKPDHFKLLLNFPAGYQPVNVRGYDAKNHTLTLETTVSSDITYRIKFEKK